jgi:hypothetical protein
MNADELAAVIARMIVEQIGWKQWSPETEREVSRYARRKGANKEAVARLSAEVRRLYDEAEYESAKAKATS